MTESAENAIGQRWLYIAGIAVPIWAACAALAAAGLTVVYLFDPREPGLYPVCPFFGLTGCYCPGCGRCIRRCTATSPPPFGYNPYTMLALPAVAYSLAAGGLRACGLPAPPRVFIPARWIWALLAAILAFWLMRNLPFAPFNLLAP